MLSRNSAVHSPHKAWGLALMIACAAATGLGNASADSASPAISRAETAAAVAKLRADPNLPGQRKIKTLRWTNSRATPAKIDAPPSWIVGLFDYLAQTSSLIVWLAGGLCVGVAAIWVYRLTRARSGTSKTPTASAVSRVQALDIRPQSLPEDIGAAALALQGAGRAREALSLLYRGALSRVVHRFGVIIGESYTEGEALRAVKLSLEPARAQYFSELVQLWQRAVYAGEDASRESVSRLCSGFSPALDRAAT
jgi:hypothetical protein